MTEKLYGCESCYWYCQCEAEVKKDNICEHYDPLSVSEDDEDFYIEVSTEIRRLDYMDEYAEYIEDWN